MSWQPLMNWQTAKVKADLNKNLRKFFDERGVIEVETPILSHATITDIHLEAFSTTFNFSAEGSQKLYLQTSPEFAMKRLIASGYGSIYQICKAFRHESIGKYHNPEFTILEWYRIGFNHMQLIDEVEELLIETLGVNSTERYSYQQIFLAHTNIDPLNTSIAALIDFLSLHNKLADWLAETDNIDILLQFIFCEFVETNIGKEKPCFVYGFPRNQASLARINSTDERVADRFECYFRGIELANGFYELNNSEEQKLRFETDNKNRKILGYKEKPIDFRLIEALDRNFPKCSGVALGVDRLLMLLTNSDSITDVLTFDINNA